MSVERSWTPASSSTSYHASLDIRSRYRFAYYDSLIVAAALDAGCATLYTEDLQHLQRIDGLTVVDPFTTRTA